MTESDLKRFWAKVDRSAGPGGCWPWLASDRGGRHQGGQFWISTPKGRRNRSARRIAWELAHGPVPRAHAVLTTCGQRLCMNPSHLCVAAPPWGPCGEQRATAKLTMQGAAEIRRAYSAGEGSIRVLAKRFCVNRETVHQVIKGETYRERG